MRQQYTESDFVEGSMTLEELREKTELSPEETAELVHLEDEERRDILEKLAKKITDRFTQRVSERGIKEVEWAKCQRLYNSPLLGSNVRTNDAPFAGDDDTRLRRPEPNIVRTKCDTAISTSVSMQFSAGEKNWDMFPPANEPDVAVAESCRQMEKEIQTQLDSCNYPMHARRAMEDRVIMGSGVLKGPVNTGKRKVKYVHDGLGWIPQASTDYAPSIDYVPIWRFYPDMTVTEFKECEDAIELHPMSPVELSQYVDHPGFDGDTIKDILYGDDKIMPGTYNETLANLTPEVWSRNPYLYKNKYAVLEYHGPVTYDELCKLGIEPTYESPTKEYFGEVWVCAGKVIRMELENIEGFYETPYSLSVWKRDPANVFGFGHPLLLADPQQVITQAYHMILDNAALTSGPQVAMFKKYVQPIDGNWNIQPNKIWYLTDPTQRIDDAIRFFTPTNVIANIMPVLDLARQFADEESATPAMAAGLQSPQNGESATGQLIQQRSSTTILDFLGEEWDDQVTEKIIRRMYAWNMQYNPKEDIKGDYAIDVKSSSEYKNKQMYVRDLERLSMEVNQNPALADVVDVNELTRARLQLMHLPSTKIVRSIEETQQIAQQRQQQPDPKMIELQIKQQELAVKEQDLKLRAAQLQFEMQQQQQRELWEHEERMGANQARMYEAQASVLKSRSEYQTEMLKLAQKDEFDRTKLAADTESKNLAVNSQVFLAGMQQQSKSVELKNTQEELALKAQIGTGI